MSTAFVSRVAPCAGEVWRHRRESWLATIDSVDGGKVTHTEHGMLVVRQWSLPSFLRQMELAL